MSQDKLSLQSLDSSRIKLFKLFFLLFGAVGGAAKLKAETPRGGTPGSAAWAWRVLASPAPQRQASLNSMSETIPQSLTMIHISDDHFQHRHVISERKDVRQKLITQPELANAIAKVKANLEALSGQTKTRRSAFDRLIAMDFRNFYLLTESHPGVLFESCTKRDLCEFQVFLGLDNHFRVAWKYGEQWTYPTGTYNLVLRLRLNVKTRQVVFEKLVYMDTDGSNYLSDWFQSVGESQGLNVLSYPKFHWPPWGIEYQQKKIAEPILIERQKWAQRVLCPLLTDLLRSNSEMILTSLQQEAQNLPSYFSSVLPPLD